MRQIFIKKKFGPKSVRWRLHETSRIESFTDSVFAFAVTLLVVSLEVPETFKELSLSLSSMFGFAICFMMIMLIWFEQYIFFRKYGLQDTKTILMNCILLFVVLFYVYPLKFLFGFLTSGNKVEHPDGSVVYRFANDGEIGQLMVIYGVGFMVLYGVFFMMNHHAWKLRDELKLNKLEVFNTRTAMMGNGIMVLIGTLSVTFALLDLSSKSAYAFLSGMCYALIGPSLGIFYNRRAKKIKKLFTQDEIDEVANQVVTITVSEFKDTSGVSK